MTVNLAESPLSWLHVRGHLSDRRFDAAERLRLDYEKAQLAPSVTMRWDPVRIKGGPDAGLCDPRLRWVGSGSCVLGWVGGAHSITSLDAGGRLHFVGLGLTAQMAPIAAGGRGR